MRYFWSVFAVCFLVTAAVGAYFYLPVYQKAKQANFVPIEVDEQGFAKKTLKDSEIKDIYNTETALTIEGGEDSALKIVVFYDYNCPYCMIEEATLHEALENRSDVRVILRPVPFMGDESFAMAKLAMAAARLGVFAEFHDAIFNAQGKMTQERALALIEDRGLPVASIVNLSNDAIIRAAVEDNHNLALKVGAHYVPSFVIGRRLYMPLDRDTTVEEFHELFDQELMR